MGKTTLESAFCASSTKVASSAESSQKSEASIEDLFGFPVEDPALTLHETAQRLLEAARRLLLKGGFEALSLDAIAAEAGKNKASVKYHFGNKDGLMLAIVDSLDYKDCLALAEQTRGTAGEERLELYVAGQTRLAGDADGFLVFYDMLPHVLRDERMRQRVAALYEWYYKMNVEWLGLADRVHPEDRAELMAFVSLMVAVVDGLAVQAALRPKGFDLEGAFAVLRRFLKFYLDESFPPKDTPHAQGGTVS